MGTLINALKEIFSGSSQTRPTNIPTCASDGTPNGNVTDYNLISTFYEVASSVSNFSGNFNDVYVSPLTLYTVNGASNAPTTSPFLFKSERAMKNSNNGRIVQQAWTLTGTYYYRVKESGIWTAWKEVSTDIPSFYKDYTTFENLTNAINRFTGQSMALDVGESITINVNMKCAVFVYSVRGDFTALLLKGYDQLWIVGSDRYTKENDSSKIKVVADANSITLTNNLTGSTTISYKCIYI